MRRTDALVVGGGPAGAACAILLARAGASPLVIDRASGERDVVCGGFLGWDALARLEGLGLDPSALGARPIERLRLVAGAGCVEASLPQRAAGLSRRRLDAALLGLAEAAGAGIYRGVTARAYDPDSGRLRLDDDSDVEAAAFFLATGKHELRGLARPLNGRAETLAVGLRTLLPTAARIEHDLSGYIELHLFDQGYAGLLLEEDGVNLCLSVSRARLGAAGSPGALLTEIAGEAPRLAERIGSIPDRWDAVAGVPYGWRATSTEPRLFRIGDQAAVIASLAGDGIAIALASGEAAAQAWIANGPDAAVGYQRAFARSARRPLRVGELLRRGAERGLSRAGMMMAVRLAPSIAGVAAKLTRIG